MLRSARSARLEARGPCPSAAASSFETFAPQPSLRRLRKLACVLAPQDEAERAPERGVTVFRREASATLHPHAEERTQCASRSMRPVSVRGRPSFETLAALAPQDEAERRAHQSF